MFYERFSELHRIHAFCFFKKGHEVKINIFGIKSLHRSSYAPPVGENDATRSTHESCMLPNTNSSLISPQWATHLALMSCGLHLHSRQSSETFDSLGTWKEDNPWDWISSLTRRMRDLYLNMALLVSMSRASPKYSAWPGDQRWDTRRRI